MNLDVYSTLLASYCPRPIADDTEHDRQLAIVEGLMKKGDAITSEEDALLGILSLLIVDYEETRYPIEPVPPVEILKFLMEQNDLKQKDLVSVLGSSSRVSDILNGKRLITRGQAKRLAERFGVSMDLFY